MINKFMVFVFALLGFYYFANGQDSVWEIHKKMENATGKEKVILMNELSKAIINTDPEQALTMAVEVLQNSVLNPMLLQKLSLESIMEKGGKTLDRSYELTNDITVFGVRF